MAISRRFALSAAMAALLACGQAPAPNGAPDPTALADPSLSAPQYSAIAIVPSGIRHFHGENPPPLAPGMLASIYGERLGPETACTGSPDPERRETPNPLRPVQTLVETQVFPTTLCDVQVLVGGVPAGLLYVHAGQINFKVPQDAPVEGATDVQVTHQGSAGPAVRVSLTNGPATAPAEQLAETMWSGLQSVRWDSAYQPASNANATCAAVPTHPDLRLGLFGHAYYCSQTTGNVIAESFYFPVAGDPPKVLLRRADFRLDADYPPMSAEVEQRLIQRLTRAYAPGAGQGERLYEIGDPKLSWRSDSLTIFLHQNRKYVAGPGIRQGVQLIAVRPEVLQERERNGQLREAFETTTMLSHPKIAEDLRAELGALYLPPVERRDYAEAERAALSRDTRAALLGVLRTNSEGSRARRAALLVAADDLTVRLGNLLVARSIESGSESLAEAPEAAEVRRELAPYNVAYTRIGHYSGDLEYNRSLLIRAWREFPETPWGQRAFLMLQKLACAVPEVAGEGPDCYRNIIQQGEAFLRDRPDTPFRKEQLYHLALAYETWWSMSQIEEWDPAYGAPIDAASAERARRRAIELYEELSRVAADSAESRAGQLALPRLQLRLGTGQRAFFCFLH